MTLDPTDPKDRRNKYREFDPALISSFLGDRTISRSERISTGKSNTNIKLVFVNTKQMTTHWMDSI